jgi:dTDP-D-glucose 4,6-dehydratase
LGYDPTIGFAEGLAHTARWYHDNREWWSAKRPDAAHAQAKQVSGPPWYSTIS